MDRPCQLVWRQSPISIMFAYMTTRQIARGMCIPMLLYLLGSARGAAQPAAPVTLPDEVWAKLEKARIAFEADRREAVTEGGMESFFKEYFPKAGALADNF